MQAFKNMVRTRRFWVWVICGALIYSVPAAIRLATGSVNPPILSLVDTNWISMFIPGNLVEKIFVNAFFPGGAGAVAGEIFFTNAKSKMLLGREKYAARLCGALLAVLVWTLVQFSGSVLGIAGSWGGNLFEYPTVYPLNFLLASLSIFTPTIIYFLKNGIINSFHKVSPHGVK